GANRADPAVRAIAAGYPDTVSVPGRAGGPLPDRLLRLPGRRHVGPFVYRPYLGLAKLRPADPDLAPRGLVRHLRTVQCLCPRLRNHAPDFPGRDGGDAPPRLSRRLRPGLDPALPRQPADDLRLDPLLDQ